ncbi:MAG: D-glycero-beta-D-manno-heptose 1-phosphate adenylyltransferase [Saprospiraceae bacterium]
MIQSKIFTSIAKLSQRVKEWQNSQYKVVFTNGCFDILHKGHVVYLEEAKQEGQILIVGVNSDASVKKLKGQHRPIVTEEGRVSVLAALESVDAVILFDEDTPLQLIQNIGPDILVKGGDYDLKDIVGSDFVLQKGGRVKQLSLIEGYSTSMIEQKIKSFC